MTFTGAAATALEDRFVRAPFLGFVDFDGDPVKATTWKTNLSLTGTGDPDLDTGVYSAIDYRLLKVGKIVTTERGTQTLTVQLSGLPIEDADLINIVGDESKWKGRRFRLWRGIFDAADAQVGEIAEFYTGRMTQVIHVVEPPGDQGIGESIINIECETFRANMPGAANRTYMDQAEYDAADRTAEAILTLANGGTGRNPATQSTPVGPAYGTGGIGPAVPDRAHISKR